MIMNVFTDGSVRGPCSRAGATPAPRPKELPRAERRPESRAGTALDWFSFTSAAAGRGDTSCLVNGVLAGVGTVYASTHSVTVTVIAVIVEITLAVMVLIFPR